MPVMTDNFQKVLGFDFGTVRMGAAYGQSITGTASALPTFPAKDGIPDWDYLQRLINEHTPQALIVGLPLNLDGSVSEMAYRARKFANRMHELYQLPVFLMDERLSTAEAKEIHLARGGSNNFKKEAVDSIAAQLIVENWFGTDQRIPSNAPLEKFYAS